MTADPKLVAEFFTYSPTDFAAMRIAQPPNFTSRRKLDSDTVRPYSKHSVITRRIVADASSASLVLPAVQQRPLNAQEGAVGVFGGVVFAVGGLALFMFTLWVLTAGPFK